MTPSELDLIASDSAKLFAHSARFSTSFYETLFEIAPKTRTLFSADLTAQREKLMLELETMIQAATAYREPDKLAEFTTRTRDLGARHVAYGVTPIMYSSFRVALLAALRDCIPEFDEERANAWTKLHGLVAETMLQGATPIQMRGAKDV